MFKQMIPELTVENVERSIKFYTETLGFTVLATAPEIGKPVWAELSCAGYHLMLQGKEEMYAEMPQLAERNLGGTMLLVFRIDGQDTVRSLWASYPNKDQAVLPLRETDYGTVEFGATDPDGYVFILAGQ